ncbi:MerR family transcriptional regulator [Metapseudomonas resinovorans]|uniref:Putative MerR family transcriptional regulator n=1 Tax=Metapseudomonas resinovorans NBRC 106553 TaxID=1245471 RepID=S6AZY7_METRE|nr:MerR family transcriptional regulator [Pseudomonas resinovorans]BAN50491.1 putative MerR family transcriptional regulator [Pseudomonas resinovorans NBRC 106553]
MTDPGASLASTALKQEEVFPIREVSRLTGVNPVTLRAWERRYGLIQPTRTESGHRLYSLADVDAVRSILAWIERGVSVSKVGKLLARSSAVKAPLASVREDLAAGEWGEWRAQVRAAVATLDEAELERVYGQVFSTYPLPVVFADVLMPVWQTLLLRQDEFGRGSEWVFFDSFLRARALQRLQLARSGRQERVLLAPLPGPGRELELLVAGLLLGGGELSVSVLGLGQPLAELAMVCGKLRPQALVLFSNQPPADDLGQQLARLALGLDCPLALAGEVADLMDEELEGTPVACLGSEGRLMQRRLRQFLAGHLDT